MKVRLRIREIAESKKVSRTRLHHDSEVAYGTIRKIFQNPYTEITTTTLSRLAYALDVRTIDTIEDVSNARYEEEMKNIQANKRGGASLGEE